MASSTAPAITPSVTSRLVIPRNSPLDELVATPPGDVPAVAAVSAICSPGVCTFDGVPASAFVARGAASLADGVAIVAGSSPICSPGVLTFEDAPASVAADSAANVCTVATEAPEDA